jgi:hypothetical protein
MALPVLKCILETSQDYEMKQEACWAITHVTSQQTEYVRAFVHAGFVPVLFSMLGTPHPRLLSPVIRVLGNIVSCDADDLTDMVLGHGILRVLRALLRTSDSMLIQSVLCITANILAGSSVQRQQVIQSMILPDILYTVSDPNAAAKTLTEAGFVVANLLVADNATPEQRQLALDIGALPVILRVLDLDVQVVQASDPAKTLLIACLGTGGRESADAPASSAARALFRLNSRSRRISSSLLPSWR